MGIGLSKGFPGSGGLSRRIGLYPILLGMLALLILIQTVRLIWIIATPLGPVGDWRADEVKVLSPGSRLSLFSSFDPFFRSNALTANTVVTSLQLTLYGTRMNEGSGLGSAILAGPDGVQDSYAVGDEIMPGVTLDSVRFDHVSIDRGGVKESLYLDQSVPAETVNPKIQAEPTITSEPDEAIKTNLSIERPAETVAGEEKTVSDPAATAKGDDVP